MKSSELMGKKVVIAPFCQEAIFTYHRLKKQNIEVIAFMDADTSLYSKQYLNIPVIPYFHLNNTVAIISNTVTVNSESIGKSLTAVGYENFIKQSDIHFDISFEDVADLIDTDSFLNIKGYQYAIPIKREIARAHAKSGLYTGIKFISVEMTNKCTLNCRYCCTLMPFQKESTRKIYDVNIIMKSLDKLIDYVDFIPEISLIGGEPFLNKNLKKLLIFLNHGKLNSKVGRVVISTNGTIVPDLETIEIISQHKNRIYLYISTYGDHSKKAYDLLKICNQYGISYVAYSNRFWTDMCQPFDPATGGYSLPEAQENCSKCKFIINKQFRIAENKLYKCSFLSYGELGKVIPEDKRNSIDLLNDDFSSEILQKYMADFQPGLAYCSAPVLPTEEWPAGNVFPAGVQAVTKPEYAQHE